MTMDAFRSPDLTRAILARTTGGSCEALRAQACAFVDGGLEPLRADLVAAHLAHCPACTQLVATLRAAAGRLPELRAADPGPSLTARVLRATTQRPRATPGTPRFWQRPRLALEAAYLGAAAGFFALHLPGEDVARVVRVPALVRPLSDSARRVAAAEVRTARAVRDLVVPASGRPEPFWKRVWKRVRSGLRILVQSPPANP